MFFEKTKPHTTRTSRVKRKQVKVLHYVADGKLKTALTQCPGDLQPHHADVKTNEPTAGPQIHTRRKQQAGAVCCLLQPLRCRGSSTRIDLQQGDRLTPSPWTHLPLLLRPAEHCAGWNTALIEENVPSVLAQNYINDYFRKLPKFPQAI